jgi:predicted metal-dependent peptidase
MADKNKTLSKATKTLMLKEPFYGLFLISLNKEWDERIPTAGVAKHNIGYKLKVNTEFWNSLSENHQLGLLKHELLHIVFFHVNIHEEFADKKLANIAMDIEINQYISSDILPDGALLPSTFPELNLPLKAGCREYYKLLQKEANNSCSNSPNLEQMLQESGKWEIDGGGNVRDQDGNIVPVHNWQDFEGLSEAEKKLLESQTQHVLNDIANSINKTCGNIPGEIVGLLKSLQKEPPKFDWRGYLRRFSGGSQKVYTRKLKRKPNKRFDENPGLKIKQRRHMLLAIDTSGSVNENELKEFFSEIDHIHKTGTEITVVQCDTAISNISGYKPNQDIKIYGRGGTSFQPVIDYYNDNFHKYTSLVYFTDGEAYSPDSVRGRILWVLSSQSTINNELPGQVIKLN